MSFRRLFSVAVLLACLAVPTAASSTGNGLIAYEPAYFVGILASDPETGTGLHLVGDAYEPAGWPFSWAPDGTWLLYQGLDASVVRADGTSAHAVVDDSDPSHAWLAICWLDTELVVLKKVTFLGPSTAGPNVADFYVARPDGGGLAPLTTGGLEEESVGACAPATRTLYITRSDGTHWSVSPGGSLTRLPFSGGTITPSPDGRLIAWLMPAGLFVVKEGKTLSFRKLVDAPAGSAAVWSPDSQQIAVGGVRVVSLATGAIRALSQVSGGPVAWSPDGTQILFLVGLAQSAPRGAYLMNADGTCEHPFVGISLLGPFSFAWQPVPGRAPSPPLRCTDTGITSTVSPETEPDGDVATFTVANDGTEPAAETRFEIGQALGGGVIGSLSSSQGSCDAATASCDLGTLGPRASATVTVALRLTDRDRLIDGAAVVGARVLAKPDDSNTFNNEGTLRLRPFACTAVGTLESDILSGTPARDTLCGLDGADRLSGLAGRDRLVGGSGNDLLRGGPNGDWLVGSDGNDAILARDGVRDTIDCGTGRDRVVADRVDRVSQNCESVLRHRGKFAHGRDR